MKISALGETGPASRTQLTRQRVVAAAVELAGSEGTESVSMRRLAQEPGVEAMSLESPGFRPQRHDLVECEPRPAWPKAWAVVVCQPAHG